MKNPGNEDGSDSEHINALEAIKAIAFREIHEKVIHSEERGAEQWIINSYHFEMGGDYDDTEENKLIFIRDHYSSFSRYLDYWAKKNGRY
ncbi:hypothetical protein [Pedobacter steynii]|uniref:Uncharacterized protein n=1 Tax=Pedobacter steynii TaxID=430522 RepID=A0A1D7QIH2_9SPHI|nr:hypothetical protein [Pedobacter steynii]AOM78409.1 hypothetical protein BFS30_15215 [Pedobacter steynii]